MTDATLAMNARALKEKRELSFAQKGLFVGAQSGFLWGLAGVLMGVALGKGPMTLGKTIFTAPLVGVVLHDFFASIGVFVYNWKTGRSKEIFRSLRTRPGWIVCLAAIFGGPVAMSGYLLGIDMAGPAYAMGISALFPVFGAVMAQLFLKEKISRQAWIGIMLCVVGSIVLGYTPPESGANPHFYLGIGLALVAALGWGIEGVIATFGMDMVDSTVAINLRETTSWVTTLVLVLPFVSGLPLLGQAIRSPSVLGIIALAGLVGGFSYLFYYKSFNMCGVGRSMALNMTYVIWGVILSFFFTDTAITTTLVTGSVLITLGGILVVANPKELLNLRG